MKRPSVGQKDFAPGAKKRSSRRLMSSAQRKAGEEKIKTSERRLSEAQRVAHIGSWEWDMRTGEVNWTDELFRIFGYEPQQLPITLAFFLGNMVHKDDRKIVQHAIEASSVSCVPFEYEARILRRDGSVRVAQCQAEVLRDQAGQAERMHGTLQDVTEKKQLEEQLRQAQKMEVVGQLAGGIAHDFNNILTVIGGCAQLLLIDGNLGPEGLSEVEEIMAAWEHASSLTSQLLTFSRRQMNRPELLDLNAVMARTKALLRRVLPEDIELSIITSPELGTVRADTNQIEQVIMNLVVNARDAMPTGGRVTIETANAEMNGSYVVLKVADNGCGMDEQTRLRIFEPFFTTKESGSGTGLGLATVYGIVKQSGGFITTESELGTGTTFQIYLPRITPAAPLSSSSGACARSIEASETILLVEDEAAVRRIAQKMLLREGYTVLAADGIDAACEICATHRGPIHLLLSDVIMPGVRGRNLAKEIKTMRPDIRVLFMSGYTGNVIMAGMLDPGVAFLKKPFTSEALTAKIREALA